MVSHGAHGTQKKDALNAPVFSLSRAPTRGPTHFTGGEGSATGEERSRFNVTFTTPLPSDRIASYFRPRSRSNPGPWPPAPVFHSPPHFEPQERVGRQR